MIKVARINRLFGTDGSVVLTLYREFPDELGAGEPLFVEIDSLEVPLYRERMEFRGATGAVVRFDDFDTPRRAEELLGRELYVHEPPADSSDEFCMEDLIGFAVDASSGGGRLSGLVSDYYDSEANPLFGIRFEGRAAETLVPAVEEFVAGIDFEGRRLRMVLPDGLLDL